MSEWGVGGEGAVVGAEGEGGVVACRGEEGVRGGRGRGAGGQGEGLPEMYCERSSRPMEMAVWFSGDQRAWTRMSRLGPGTTWMS